MSIYLGRCLFSGEMTRREENLTRLWPLVRYTSPTPAGMWQSSHNIKDTTVPPALLCISLQLIALSRELSMHRSIGGETRKYIHTFLLRSQENQGLISRDVLEWNSVWEIPGGAEIHCRGPHFRSVLPLHLLYITTSLRRSPNPYTAGL